MTVRQWRKLLAALVLSVVLLVSGCSQKEPSPYSQAQQESTQRDAQPAVAKDATQGSTFNQFFPASGQGYEVVFTQEKKGFAEAKLKQGGQEMAVMAVSDTTSLPQAAQKFQSAAEKLAGYPVLEIGSTQTAVLVADRYQVKVLSRDPAFTQQNRRDWLQKFDLTGLANLN